MGTMRANLELLEQQVWRVSSTLSNTTHGSTSCFMSNLRQMSYAYLVCIILVYLD